MTTLIQLVILAVFKFGWIMTTSRAFTDLDALVEHVEPVFDEVVAEGSDDELFASGYLRGHFDLVAAQLALSHEQDPAALWPALSAAIDQASHELTPADQVHVKNLYRKLQHRGGFA